MNELECGRIVNTHGIRGEVKIDCYCDLSVLAGLKTILVAGKPYGLISCRSHKGFALAVLEGVDSVEQAQALKGAAVTADRKQISLPAGTFFYSDLFGFSVFDLRRNACIGKLRSVQETPASMLYLIDGDGGEILIPAVPAFDRGIDWDARQLRVETILGMLPDEN